MCKAGGAVTVCMVRPGQWWQVVLGACVVAEWVVVVGVLPTHVPTNQGGGGGVGCLVGGRLGRRWVGGLRMVKSSAKCRDVHRIGISPDPSPNG